MVFSQYGDAYENLATLAIIVYNLLFYLLAPIVVTFIKYKSQTSYQSTVARIVIICLIIDMIVLPVLTGANSQDWYIFKSAFQGKFTDTSDGWYDLIGRQIFKTMIVFSLQALIDFIVEKLTVVITQWFSKRSVDNLSAKSQMLVFID